MRLSLKASAAWRQGRACGTFAVDGEEVGGRRGDDCAPGPLEKDSKAQLSVVAEYSFNTFKAESYQWGNRKRGPHPDSIMFRSTRSLSDGKMFESRIPVHWMTEETQQGKLPYKCDIKTTLYYDPDIHASKTMEKLRVSFADNGGFRSQYYEEDSTEVIEIPAVGLGMKVGRSKDNAALRDWVRKATKSQFHPSRGSIAVA